MVFTLDALHTDRRAARLITQELHAHWVVILTGNQPYALEAARAALTGVNADSDGTPLHPPRPGG
jgi:hypothetical protein